MLGAAFLPPKPLFSLPVGWGRDRNPRSSSAFFLLRLTEAPSLLLSLLAHGPSPWPLFSSPVEAPGSGTEVPVVWAQEGAPAQLPCSPTIPLQDVSLLRTAGVTWHHLPDRYAPLTWEIGPPKPRAMASRLTTPGPSQPSVSSPELSVALKPWLRFPRCLSFFPRKTAPLTPASLLHLPLKRVGGAGPTREETGMGSVSGPEISLLGGFPHRRSGVGLPLAPGFFPPEFLSPVLLSRPAALRLPRPPCAPPRRPRGAPGRGPTWC